MSRAVTLDLLKGGIDRLRVKGGANPSSLYDLLNGYIDIEGSVQSRPGTVADATLPAGTLGLCAYQDGFVVFADEMIDYMPDGYTCRVVAHPSDDTQTLSVIHFAAAFMGFLYVVAEFSNGDVFHYWLQTGDAWQASKTYDANAIVSPGNGLNYRATRLSGAYPAWAAKVPRAVNDVVEPTEYNGFFYTVTSVSGTNPASGDTEPDWPTETGSVVIEDTNELVTQGSASTTEAPVKPTLPPKYDEPGYPKVVRQ